MDNYIQIAKKLYQQHDSYKETSLKNRYLKHKDTDALIQKLKSNPDFEIEKIGDSLEKRAIHTLKWGEGKTKIFLWSQMHGDEPTATMALFDIFNFLSGNDAEFKELRETLKKQLTLCFLPMLNPDGTERFQRRTALNIDMNRDFLQAESVETQHFKTVLKEIQADFSFNLHDQNPYYSVGQEPFPVAVVFLAPSYNYECSTNACRKEAMQVIALMTAMLNELSPNRIAKYSDEHEPRSYGDSVQKTGSSTILVESGFYPNDPEKQEIRKLNFVSILMAMATIAQKDYTAISIEKYDEIPQNKKLYHDIIFRNVEIEREGASFRADIGLRKIKGVWTLMDMGDLSTFFGHKEVKNQDLIILEKDFVKLELEKEVLFDILNKTTSTSYELGNATWEAYN